MKRQPTRLPFFTNCVNWPAADVDRPGGLCDMIEQSVRIQRRSFRRHVTPADLARLEVDLGYFLQGHAKGRMTMARDWAVSYHRSRLHGHKVWYFWHSAVEYVFAPAGAITKIRARDGVAAG